MSPGTRLSAIVPRTTNPYFFVIIYLGWAWFFWAFIVLSGEVVWTVPYSLLFYVGALSPLLGGILLTYRLGAWSGLRDLWDRTVNVRRISRRWYAICIFLQPAMTLLAAGIALLAGTSGQPLNPSISGLLSPNALAFFLTFTLLAGTVEEIGLTGYFVHRLLEVRGVVAVGLITGVVWAVWHVPLFLMEGYYGPATADPDPAFFFPGLLFTQIIYAWIYDNTAESVLAAIIYHTAINVTGETLGPSEVVGRYTFYLTVVLCLLILLHEEWVTPSGLGNRLVNRD
ncbi:CAAX protease family protein [Halobiforma lacisalsi AJ5]|uniref:Abortive infection protein n=2 Tax=Natronobacterium TaxID=2256 RepID=M0LR89_NATLA|nr:MULTISPECIES: type II CAAX endopeptidase family protein [Halobiforma]APW99608.1 CAAX protease family protein [Halobiforma lacisalsi AJ5]EMA35608.1 abortive infection protein [Halobiforma lacisalsi AJ5]SFC08930.1 CAAX protease self-immunity [Halobiforma haloterrestris]